MDDDTGARTLQFTSAELSDHFSCPVCHKWLSSAFSTQCGHVLCGGCISKWLEHSGTCPVCRTALQAAPSRCFPLEAFLHERLLPQLHLDAAPSCADSPAKLAKAVAAAFERRQRCPAPQLQAGPLDVLHQTIYDGVRAAASLYDGSWGSSDDEDEDAADGDTAEVVPTTPQPGDSRTAAVATHQPLLLPYQQGQQHHATQQHNQQHDQQQQQQQRRRQSTLGRNPVMTYMESPTIQHWQLLPVMQQAPPSQSLPQPTLRTTAREYYHNPHSERVVYARRTYTDADNQRDQ